MTDRKEIFRAIGEEREYQIRRWGDRLSNIQPEESYTIVELQKSICDHIVYMEHYLTKAKEAATLSISDNDALNELRKVVTLGVACFEQHGIPTRDLSQPFTNKRDGDPA